MIAFIELLDLEDGFRDQLLLPGPLALLDSVAESGLVIADQQVSMIRKVRAQRLEGGAVVAEAVQPQYHRIGLPAGCHWRRVSVRGAGAAVSSALLSETRLQADSRP